MLVVVLVAGLGVGRAQAQASLEPNVVTASTMGPDQRRAIDQFAGYYVDDLISADPNKRSPARTALLEPLDNRNVSVDFRMHYSDRLMDELRRVAGHEDTRIAINGLRIAGALATEDSTELLIEASDDDRDDVRYVSAWGIRQTFEEVGRSAPAIDQIRIQELVELLELRLGIENEPHVFDVVGRALTAAGRLDHQRWRAIRDYAQHVQARVTAVRVKTLNPGPNDTKMLIAVARTLDAQVWFIKDNIASDEVMRGAAGLAGQVVSYAGSRAKAGDLDDKERLELQDLVKRAEALIFFAHNALDPAGRHASTDLADLLAQDGDPQMFDDQMFADEAVKQVIGHGGVLCQPPFRFPATEFARGDP